MRLLAIAAAMFAAGPRAVMSQAAEGGDQTCTTDDVDCVWAPSERTCSWPEWNGENTAGVVCELVPYEGCEECGMQCDQSNGCYENWESTCELEADGSCMACSESAHSLFHTVLGCANSMPVPVSACPHSLH